MKNVKDSEGQHKEQEL